MGLVSLVKDTTVGEVIDMIANDPYVQQNRDQSYEIQTTIGRIINLIGAEKVKAYMIYDVRGDKFNPEYELTGTNVGNYWLDLIGFALIFAALATITLEFIDKDKR